MSAATTPRLRVCTFRGLQNLPLYVAAREGLFGAAGLEVEVLYTSGSAAQVAGLARDEYDLIQTAPDNVIHADHDPVAFGLVPAAPSIAMVLGGSVGPLSLFARPAVAATDGLRGAVVGVDNPGSGFALVLRDMLARAGLALDRDYTFAVAGGTSARLDALRGGAAPSTARGIAATILYPPYDALAEAAGFRRLASSPELYPAYASLATAATRAWIAAHADALTRYLAAVLRALRRIHDPAQAGAVRALLRDELALDPATAARAYDAFVAPATGFGAEAALDEAGLRQVIALRAAYAPPARPLGPPAAYRDPRCYERARAAL